MVQVYSESFESKVSSKRLWHGLFKDAHNCLPKAVPSKVKSVEYPLGQHGFDFPGAERIIKFQKEVSEDVHKTEKEVHKKEEEKDFELHKKEKEAEKDVHAKQFELHKKEEEAKKDVHEKEKEAEKELHKEEGVVKGEAEKVGEEVHKEGLLAKGKAEEVVGKAEEEAGEAKEKVEKAGKEEKKEAEHLKEGVSGIVQKGVKYIKETVGGAESKSKELVEKEKEEAKKGIEIGKKVSHEEEEKVGGALQKVGEFFKKEEVWVKEKIGEVEYEALKITIHVVAGGFLGILFKHYKHTFELKEHEAHGSILHWTTEFEFEELSSIKHFQHSFEKLKEHVLLQFHGVEEYLLKHDDYAELEGCHV